MELPDSAQRKLRNQEVPDAHSSRSPRGSCKKAERPHPPFSSKKGFPAKRGTVTQQTTDSWRRIWESFGWHNSGWNIAHVDRSKHVILRNLWVSLQSVFNDEFPASSTNEAPPRPTDTCTGLKSFSFVEEYFNLLPHSFVKFGGNILFQVSETACVAFIIKRRPLMKSDSV